MAQGQIDISGTDLHAESMADGIAVTVSGLLGGVASDTSSSNVSLSAASGATSKWIGVTRDGGEGRAGRDHAGNSGRRTVDVGRRQRPTTPGARALTQFGRHRSMVPPAGGNQ